DIVIPTWFHLNDSRGSLRNLADPAYVHWARERGYSVWALVNNSFDPELTAEFLSSSSARKAAINQLLLFARLYRLEGFNLDFENFHHRYRELYTQFVRELAVMCREAGLVLSVNVTVPEGEPYWSLCYDRASLAREADYIVLMAYDEHWSSSPVAGSVSSLPWVEKNLSAVLKEVPAEKLILGVPFYTRLWRIDEEGGDRSISSRDYGMKRIEEILAGKDLEIGWDESNGQYLVEYREGECTFMAWLEESNSMERRLQLVNSYRLAGVAGWRRGLEKPEIWELIENVLGKASP
ncbi:MAG TPA: glycosyl hydrolase family 18 protein, partial [Bacillota bacterium]|nr:glycosyl hydrolase family 18 protein [Bacillota bacterium]